MFSSIAVRTASLARMGQLTPKLLLGAVRALCVSECCVDSVRQLEGRLAKQQHLWGHVVGPSVTTPNPHNLLFINLIFT